MSTRPEFSFDRPFVASVSGGMVWNGHRYALGEAFPARQLGLSNEEMWELWTQFQIDNAPTVPVKSGCQPPQPQQQNKHRR